MHHVFPFGWSNYKLNCPLRIACYFELWLKKTSIQTPGMDCLILQNLSIIHFKTDIAFVFLIYARPERKFPAQWRVKKLLHTHFQLLTHPFFSGPHCQLAAAVSGFQAAASKQNQRTLGEWIYGAESETLAAYISQSSPAVGGKVAAAFGCLRHTSHWPDGPSDWMALVLTNKARWKIKRSRMTEIATSFLRQSTPGGPADWLDCQDAIHVKQKGRKKSGKRKRN